MIKKLLSIVIFVSLILTGLSIAINNPIDPKKAQAAPITVPAKPTMNDYWNGTAEFKLYNEMKASNKNDWQPNANSSLDNGFGGGTKIIDNNGTWYWVGAGFSGGNCPGRSDPVMRVTMRKSIDRGQTWSAPINPLPVTSYSDCNASNGSVFWDAVNNRWAMLYQCFGSGNNYKWQGCLAFRNNGDPFGAFVPYTNPVFDGNYIGNSLCSTNYDCGNGGFHPFGLGLNYYNDEGTFDIIGKIGNDYVVSAHLYITNGNRSGEGVRIIIKSTDWINWRVGDNGQRFPILDKSLQSAMLENWTDGAKGFGHGDSLQESGYTYQVSEAVSKNLLCQGNQKWDVTLQRIPTNAINANANWEMYSKNPITYSSSQLLPSTGQTSACNPNRAGIFKDSLDFTYYHLSRVDEVNNGIEMYQLQWKRNIIQNGDFVRGQINNWSYAGVNGSVSRNHLDASDNNFALKIDVNNPSLNGSVYAINQTPVIPSYVGQTYQQTVKVKSTVGMNGMMRVIQVDSAGNWLASQDKNFSSNINYKEIVQNGITILPNAVSVYTVIYPIGNGTMYIDEAGLEQNTPKQSNLNYCLNQIKIMTIGDSNTDGYVNLYDGYRPHLWNKMQTGGYTIDMVGSKNNNNNVNNFPNYDGDHDGRGAHTSLMSKGFLINNQTANVTKPDFLLLMSGTVDIIFASSVNEAVIHYEELIREFYLQSPTTKIIATKILPFYANFYDSNSMANVNVFNNRLATLIPTLQAQGIPITLLEQVNLPNSEIPDNIHPNDIGAEKVANNFYQKLKTTQEFQTQEVFCPNQYLISANSSSQAAVVSSTNQATVSSQNAFNSSSNQGLSSQNQANSSQVAFNSNQTALSSNNALSSITNQISSSNQANSSLQVLQSSQIAQSSQVTFNSSSNQGLSSQNQANSSQQAFQSSITNQISSNNANSSQVANSSFQVLQSSQNAFNSSTTANSSLNNANSSQQAFQSSQIAQSSTANQIVSSSNQAFSSQNAQSSQNQANSSYNVLSSQNTFNSSEIAFNSSSNQGLSSQNQANSSQVSFNSNQTALSSITNQTSSNNANSSQVAFTSTQTANSSQQAQSSQVAFNSSQNANLSSNNANSSQQVFVSSQTAQSSQNAFNSITTANSSLNNANSSFQNAFNSQTAQSSQNAFNSSSNQVIASNSSQVSSIAISSQNSSVSQISSLVSSSNSQISSQNSSIISNSSDSSQNISSTSTCQIVIPLNDPCPNGGSSSANISPVNSSANSSQNSSLVSSVVNSSQAFSSQNSSVNSSIISSSNSSVANSSQISSVVSSQDSSVISSSNSSVISNISSQNISSVQSQSSIIPSSQNVVSSQVSSQSSSIISSTNSSAISSLTISSQVSSSQFSSQNSSTTNSSLSNSSIVSSQNSSQNVVSSQVSSLVSSSKVSQNSSVISSQSSNSQNTIISPTTNLISPITDVISSIVRTITNIFNPPQLKQSIKNPAGLSLEDFDTTFVRIFK